MELVVALLMVFTAFFLLRSEWEKLQLTKEHYRIISDKIKTGESFRLVFFSDLHTYLPLIHDPQKILREIEEENPDLVILGGDMLCVNRQGGIPGSTEPVLSLIRRLCEKFPVIYGEGNHEKRLFETRPEVYWTYRRALTDMGVVFLCDESFTYREKLCITGISLDMEYYRKLSPGFGKKIPMKEGYLEEKSGLSDTSSYNIFLVHSPLYLSEAHRAGADLVLSGHMHGGTVRLPGGTGLMTPQYQFFVKECSGHHEEDGTHMIVTRGIGTHSIRIRFHNLPEISVVELGSNDGKTDL